MLDPRPTPPTFHDILCRLARNLGSSALASNRVFTPQTEEGFQCCTSELDATTGFGDHG